MRVVVVGASSGLGRCRGVGLAQRGAQVALLARRLDLLESAVSEGGGETVAIRCDVTDPESVADAIERSAEALGGIDALIYCPGLGLLRRIEDLDADTWAGVFATNVIGASEVTRAALPHLRASHGMAAYLTSVSASMTAPWPGLSSYIVTKAALDKLVDAWRAEHPEIGFTRVVVGECLGGDGPGATQLTSSWDAELAGEMFGVWFERGLITDKLMEVEHLVDAVDGVLRTGASATIPSVSVTPRRPL